MTDIVYGSKYEHGLDTAEIAKRIRVDIKHAIQTGALPKGLKTSVRLRRFSGGSAIDAEVVGVPANFVILNPERLTYEREHPHSSGAMTFPIFTKEMYAVVDALKAIHVAYNYDGSDIMTDYFRVHFYGGVTVDYRLVEAERGQFFAAARVSEMAKALEPLWR